MSFDSPDDLNRFVSQVRADFEAAGLQAAAGRLARIQSLAFTTGSEWLGELGIAVKEIRIAAVIAPELDAKLERIMAAVRHRWPTM